MDDLFILVSGGDAKHCPGLIEKRQSRALSIGGDSLMGEGAMRIKQFAALVALLG